MIPIFTILSTIFEECNIDCILIGGYAVNSHKVTRHTADIDFMISKESFGIIKPRLLCIGYSIIHEQDVFVQLTNSNGLRDLDFMYADPVTISRFLENAKTVTIGGNLFHVPSIDHLIALKLHSIKYNPHRELVDFPDIVNLIDANKVNIENPDFAALCKKYGTNDIFDKIVSHFGKQRADYDF